MTVQTRRPLHPHPDRLLPADPAALRLSRELYESVRDEPIFSPHGHVDARLLLDDKPFPDPATLLISPDHYVTRVLHSHGVPLEQLGVGTSLGEADPREIWRIFCTRWDAFLGTPSRYWMESELASIFDVDVHPSAQTADELFDRIQAAIQQPDHRPRALFERFGIETLATTDDPCADLQAHELLAADPTFAGRVIPTFRPDRYLDPHAGGWQESIGRIGAVSGIDATSYSGFLDALQDRRRYFIEHGATATDHGVPDAGAEPLELETATQLHQRALAGDLSAAEATAYRRNMIFEMARMSVDDGLVMQLHPGVLRNHHRPSFERFGADTGHDIPEFTPYARGLQPLLSAFGDDPRLRLVLFTVDETSFSRDIAPLAGFYPSVWIGAPWWFLDAPQAIARFRAATVETAGFGKMAGFVDDTRAFCSIPARHDMSRRLDAGYLCELVLSHVLEEGDARQVIHDLVVTQPRAVFSRTR